MNQVDNRGRSDIALQGRPLADGYGVGTAYIYHSAHSEEPESRQIAPGEVAAELRRLDNAVSDAEYDLRNVEHRVLTEIGEAEAGIIAAHRMILTDQTLLEQIRRLIRDDLLDAASATATAAAAVAEDLKEAGNDYLSERADDILDVKHRILKHLGHPAAAALEHLPPGTVLVARELLPSDTLNLDRAHVTGIVLESGGRTSHAAILARAMGIPAVGSIPDAHTRIKDGDSILVDGQSGRVIINPTSGQATAFADAQRSFLDASRHLEAELGPSQTADGEPITLLANLGRPEEVPQVHLHHLDGVGLFRSEYLFIQAPEPPELDVQRAVYRKVLGELDGKPLVIRTLDLGGDKQPRFHIDRFGGNPRFGMRGLRLSLNERDLFRTQLQAIIDIADSIQRVSILFPMVIGASDLREAIELVEELTGQTDRPPLGAMIETPSALFEIEEIVDQVDFVSIGTNDLVQYLLTIERRTVETLGHEAFFQPAVLRAVAHVVRAADARGIPVSVCGEAAGDPVAAGVLVGLGICRLSMSPVRAARVRAALRRLTKGQFQELATRALKTGSRKEALAAIEAGVG